MEIKPDNLEAFSYGFFQDILTFMKILNVDILQQCDIEKIVQDKIDLKISQTRRIKKEDREEVFKETQWGKRKP